MMLTFQEHFLHGCCIHYKSLQMHWVSHCSDGRPCEAGRLFILFYQDEENGPKGCDCPGMCFFLYMYIFLLFSVR